MSTKFLVRSFRNYGGRKIIFQFEYADMVKIYFIDGRRHAANDDDMLHLFYADTPSTGHHVAFSGRVGQVLLGRRRETRKFAIDFEH